MTLTWLSAGRAALVAAVLSLAAVSTAEAHDFRSGDITIDHPIARINIGERPSAGYMTILNTGANADRLIGASSPAFGRIELHNHVMTDGAMKMVHVDVIEAPAGGMVALEQGGLHLMMFDPKEALGDGAFVPMTLEFEKAGSIEITFIGEKIGKRSGHGDHTGHGHKNHGEQKTN